MPHLKNTAEVLFVVFAVQLIAIFLAFAVTDLAGWRRGRLREWRRSRARGY